MIVPELLFAYSIIFSLSGEICAVMLSLESAISLAVADDWRMLSPIQTENAIIVMIIPISMLRPRARYIFHIAFLIVNIDSSRIINECIINDISVPGQFERPGNAACKLNVYVLLNEQEDFRAVPMRCAPAI